MATIQEIAEIAGVSRGTVDRALNDRGRIKADVAQNIKEIAERLGYEPKKKSKQNLVARRGMKLGVITQLSESPFMIRVNKGIKDAKVELEERGVELLVKHVATVDEDLQIKAIDELIEEKVSGLAIMPVESEKIRIKLNEVIEQKNIPVITFNSDIVGTKRTCYVGLDNKKSGYTAAGLMGLLTRGKGKILVITGFFANGVNSLRVDGFIEEIKRSYGDLELMGVQSSFDDAKEVERIIKNALTTTPDLAGIYVASSGQKGVQQAFKELHLEKRPYVIVYDLTPNNVEGLQEGNFDFLIDQEGYTQGRRSPQLLFDLVAKGKKPKNEYIYTDIKIKTKYNI